MHSRKAYRESSSRLAGAQQQEKGSTWMYWSSGISRIHASSCRIQMCSSGVSERSPMYKLCKLTKAWTSEGIG